MPALRDHWITALAVLGACFLLFIGFNLLVGTPDEGAETTDRIAGGGFIVGGAGMLLGLWGLRTGGLRLWMAHTLVVAGSIGVAMFFWIFGIPVVLAIAVTYAGVIRRGLQRELQPS